jgi:RNA polymerase sporulation-specific sigma factor
MSESSLLSHERTTELIVSAKQGDEEAFELLIKHNIALVKSIVKKYLNRGVEYDDLFQIGCLGLVKAVKNYDTAFDVRFSTYAVPMIAGEIKRYLRDDGMIKVSRSLKELGIKAMAVQERLSKQLNRDVGIEDIAKALDCDVYDITNALESMRPHVSIYEPVYDDSNNPATIADRLASDSNEEEMIINRVFLKEMLKSLPARDRQIIMLRYFSNKTQAEVARLLNISQVQVSRLENKILKSLRELCTKQND